MTTPRDVIATHVGRTTASMIIESLHDAGFLIIEKGAIGKAQREAVRQYREDNDNRREVRPLADMALRLLGS